jgi:sacsin
LSPHERLDTPGKGIRDDFIAHSAKANISDQLAAFSLVCALVNTSLINEAFPGTIVRVPLRTKAQAKKSEIKNLAIKPEDVLKYFEEFQREVSESLTFLKNIETVSFYSNKNKLGSSSISNAAQIRLMRRKIASAITNNSACSFGEKFEISQDYASARIKPQPQTYYVQQRVYDMRNLKMSPELKQWASDEKAVSWISLAAPLDISKPGVSHVFITLPLPIPLEKTRVNVHSLFAVKRDRRSLWTDNDSTGEVKMNEVLWNNLLVKDLMPFVWKDLLVALTKLKPSVYDYFPLTTVGPLFDSLTGDVLQQILSTKTLIWRSTTGQYVPLEQGFLVEEHDPQLLSCLKQLSVPLLIGIPSSVVQLIRKSSCPHQILTPAGLRTWLRGKIRPSDISISTAKVLLEYASSDEKMDQLYDLPLFARRNGSLTSLTKLTSGIPFKRKLYIGTAEESGLFDKNGERFLSLSTYAPKVAARIQSHISTMSASLNLEQFGIDGFRCYVQDVLFDTKFAKAKDVIDISACGADFAWIQRLWKWLDTKPVVTVAKAVQGSWLLPLEGQTLRKVIIAIRN